MTPLLLLLVVGADPVAEARFEIEVRPLLVEQCIRCHGDKKQRGGVRLDRAEHLFQAADGNAPVVKPGDAKSRLLEAVRYEGDYPMPPDGKLTPAQIAILERWVADGAHWPAEVAAREPGTKHWAFQPVRDADRGTRNLSEAIDDSLVSALKAKGIDGFAPPAEPGVWLRRVSLDLTGLPPTADELTAFRESARGDPSSAFPQAVETLLASPAFGERWGRHWLDVARYADTREAGFQVDERYPFAWTYRDWVVDAFNRDLRFDEFAKLQIAADQMRAQPDDPDLAALGFLTVGRRFSAGGEQPHDVIDDRIDVISRGLMGLSVACARCHDHKFDPIPTADYYSLYGVLAGLTAVDVPIAATAAERLKLAEFHAEQVRLRQAWEDFSLAQHTKLFGDAWSADGFAKSLLDWKRSKTGKVELPKELKRHLSQRRDRALTKAEKAGWDSVLGPWLMLARLPETGFADAAPGVLATIAESHQPVAARVAELFRGTPAPRSLAEVARRYGELFAEIDARWRASLDMPRKKGLPVATLGDAPSDEIWHFLVGPDGFSIIPVEEMKKVFGNDGGRKIWLQLQAKLNDLKNAPTAPAHAFAVSDPDSPVNPRIFVRGSPGNKGAKVPRQFLRIATAGERKPFPDGTGRKNLADAVADPTNPLTARVWVNRVWGQLFGEGIVRTPSDFGIRGDAPTHPELLDHLAATFIAGGSSTKRLIRAVVLSRAYRQSSADRPEAFAVDPANSLLGKMPRRRMDFEAYRDSVLAAAGALDPHVGGRPVDLSADPIAKRRSVYARVDRAALSTLHKAFDFANPDLHIAKRFITTGPQQAVLLLNHPFAADAAKSLAVRAAASDDRQWVTNAYRLALGREPGDGELARAADFLQLAAEPKLPQGRPVYWVYGSATWDRAQSKLTAFTPLTEFNKETWSLGKSPDGKLTATGGRTTTDPKLALVRRWVAPADGTVRIDGEFQPKAGGTAVAFGPAGVIGEWADTERTQTKSVRLKAGESLDFFVEPAAGQPAAEFDWQFSVEPVGESPMAGMVWASSGHFDGPPPKPQAPLTAREQFAQVLLLCNEFATID